MLEAERGRVQRLPAQSLDEAAGALGQQRDLGAEPLRVERIADDGAADMRHVHADLMGAAGFQMAAHQRGDGLVAEAEHMLHLEMGDGEAALAFVAHHRLFLAVARVAADGRVNDANGPLGRAPDQREIIAHQMHLAAVVGEQGRQALMGRVGLGDDEQARRILVEPVHDARPTHAADARQGVAAMADQRIDERARLVACGRMHDEAGGLVDDDEVLVLEDDVERNILALGLGRGGLGNGDFDGLAGPHLGRRVGGRLAVDRHGAALDQRLDAGARHAVARARQKAVEPLGRLHHEGVRPRREAGAARGGGLGLLGLDCLGAGLRPEDFVLVSALGVLVHGAPIA